MEHLDYKQYEKLGPFEIKDFVAKVAIKSAEDSSLTYLNAGRGNPNWIATEPRSAFFLLGQFAVTESQRVMDLPEGLGGIQHLAISVTPERFADLKQRLEKAGIDYIGPDRAEESVYFKDPDNIQIEFIRQPLFEMPESAPPNG